MVMVYKLMADRFVGYFFLRVKMDLQTIGSLLVRHGLTVAGGVLVQRGYIDSASVDTIVGAGMIVLGVLLSVLNKRAK